jgi:Protein of unknown function (DUF4238)
MGRARRNHYIPQFLLRRFASRTDGQKHLIWQLSRDGAVREISTRDAAVATDFYGDASNSIEPALAILEAGYGGALAAIDRGSIPPNDVLRQFVWTTAARTRAIREQFVDMGEATLDRVFDYLANTEEGKNELFDYSRSRPLFSDALLRKLPTKQQRQFSIRQRMELERELRQRARGSLDLPAIFAQIKEGLAKAGGFSPAAARGQLQVLRGDVRQWFQPSRWEVQPGSALILGDCCVVAVDAEGNTGSLITIGRERRRVLLPISPTQILVGYEADEPSSPVDLDAINLASAELSDSVIYASRAGDRERGLAAQIGRRAALLPEDVASEQ